MNEKPEALRLTEPEALRVADGLEGKHATGYQPYAAAELRRLHAENERLRELLLDIRKDVQTSHWHRDIDAALRREKA